ncbi:uncharacterized protein NECHADRAFT_101503 [Fusarium vanettenii 77-13-4]|uniref:Uncharacterized protein n=1 Tax=Fusarium vanettenii (strain ATCC MYA-4622 / CBS 123669 / FGSC 9596 / NRRL 45880 / 77-13-4) TaxID=660122 RepID=C7ZDC7_FUSV7|nr:uncharacterized protein NECHADRAFT_101503 [Fusarium vanettenii 77-13-4]EEU38073.1 hypothetical protein NECHADRAFT_101503 [Fusarium vanettenii 77-13-4]
MIRSGNTIQRLPPQKATDPDLIAIRAKLLNALAVKASTLVTPRSSRAASPGATPRLRSRRPAHSPSPRVVIGPKAIDLLPVELASLRLSSPLIVSSPSRLKIARKIQAIIPNLDSRILSSAVITVPTRISGRDCVISVGSGSAVTLARAVSLRKGIPHICIPTTFSGSEMVSESSTTVPRERSASKGSNSRAARAIARESKTLPAVIIYDDDLTTSSPTRFSAPSDEDIMEDRAELHTKSEDACWSYINLPGSCIGEEYLRLRFSYCTPNGADFSDFRWIYATYTTCDHYLLPPNTIGHAMRAREASARPAECASALRNLRPDASTRWRLKTESQRMLKKT